MPQVTYNKLLGTIDSGINSFLEKIPAIERKQYNSILVLVKELELSGGNIKNNLNNIRLISKIKREMDSLVLSKSYINGVLELVDVYDSIEELQKNYFSEISDKFKPKKVYEELKKVAVLETVSLLTEGGVGAAYSGEIKSLITEYITSGGSYGDLVGGLKTAMVADGKGGKLLRYAKQIATDSLNQYNGAVNKAITDDLGLDWFVYVGSLKGTSREFCLVMTDVKYFHRSEIPEIIKGNIAGKKVELNSDGMPVGFDEGTTAATFEYYRGGYQCGHSIFAVSEASVPREALDRIK